VARTVNVVVLGAGSAAQVVHLPILKRLSDVNVAGLVDPDETKARTIAERFEIEAVASTLDELAQTTGFDAVLVCSPTSEHEAGVLSALGRGAHVMCERPLVADAAGARRLIDAAADADLRADGPGIHVSRRSRGGHPFRGGTGQDRSTRSR